MQQRSGDELQHAQRHPTQRPAVLTFTDASGAATVVEDSAEGGASPATLEKSSLDEVWVVETRDHAEEAVRMLRDHSRRSQGVAYHAIDTEVCWAQFSGGRLTGGAKC